VVDPGTSEPLEVDKTGLLEVKTMQIGEGRSWVRTNDIARVDRDGFLFILGRADSAIIRGGFKIMPADVEASIREHPAVQDTCVVGIPDERLGQVPAAAVVVKDTASHQIDGTTLKEFLRARLKPYEIPIEFRFISELPRTPSLKVSQAAIRDLFAVAKPTGG
jgi:long-chain acyl-CoA synthetase